MSISMSLVMSSSLYFLANNAMLGAEKNFLVSVSPSSSASAACSAEASTSAQAAASTSSPWYSLAAS
jgi:hypothetical protein